MKTLLITFLFLSISLSSLAQDTLPEVTRDGTEIFVDEGGDPRGANSVDFQSERAKSSQAATGNFSVNLGGRNNQSAGSFSTLVGGENCRSIGFYSTVLGGYRNHALGDFTFAGGRRCVATAEGAWIFGDATNTTRTNSTANSMEFHFANGVTFVGPLTLDTLDAHQYLLHGDQWVDHSWDDTYIDYAAPFHNAHRFLTNVISAGNIAATTGTVTAKHLYSIDNAGFGIPGISAEKPIHARAPDSQIRIQDSTDSQRWDLNANGGLFAITDFDGATNPFSLTAGAPSGSFSMAANGDVSMGSGLTVDTTTLVVDAANNRVGIGTDSPTVQTQIGLDNENIGGTVDASNIRLGLTSRFSTNSGEQYTVMGYYAVSVSDVDIQSQNTGDLVNNWFTGIKSDNSFFGSAKYAIVNKGVDRLVIDSIGQVGIGTDAPFDMLEVSSPAARDAGHTAIRLNNRASARASKVDFIAGNKDTQNPYFSIETRDGTTPYAQIERFRIDQDGNFGIGTDSPAAELDVNGSVLADDFTATGLVASARLSVGSPPSTGAAADIHSTTLPQLNLKYGTSTVSFEVDSSGDMAVNPDGGDVDFTGDISASSDVRAIAGTFGSLATTGTHALDVVDSVEDGYAAEIRNTFGGAESHALKIRSGLSFGSIGGAGGPEGEFVDFYSNDDTLVTGIHYNTVQNGHFDNTCDMKLKHNITTATVNSLARLMATRVSKFNRNNAPGIDVIAGHVAQDLEKQFPEMVHARRLHYRTGPEARLVDGYTTLSVPVLVNHPTTHIEVAWTSSTLTGSITSGTAQIDFYSNPSSSTLVVSVDNWTTETEVQHWIDTTTKFICSDGLGPHFHKAIQQIERLRRKDAKEVIRLRSRIEELEAIQSAILQRLEDAGI